MSCKKVQSRQRGHQLAKIKNRRCQGRVRVACTVGGLDSLVPVRL